MCMHRLPFIPPPLPLITDTHPLTREGATKLDPEISEMTRKLR